MAFITLAGTLRDPTSELAVGDQIRFTHKSTTGETVEGAVSVLTIDPSGTYSKDLQYGLVLVEYKDVRTSQFKNLGVATVNGSNPATSIPELLNALVPVSSAELIEFQAILADAVTARNEAEAFAASIDLINDLSQAYIFDNTDDMVNSNIVFPSKKVINTDKTSYIIKSFAEATADGDFIDEARNMTLASGKIAVASSFSSKSDRHNSYIETFTTYLSHPAVPNNMSSQDSGGLMVGGGYAEQWVSLLSSGVKGDFLVTTNSPAMAGAGGSVVWPCLITYVNGDYQFNVIRSSTATSATLIFPLEQDATGAVLTPTFDENLGQHLTQEATKGFFSLIANRPLSEVSANEWILGNYALEPAKYNKLWKSNVAVNSYGVSNVNNIVTSLYPEEDNRNIKQAPFGFSTLPVGIPSGTKQGCHLTGHGIVAEINTQGFCGYISLNGCVQQNNATVPFGDGELTATITVSDENNIIFTGKIYEFNTNHKIPFSNSGKLTVSVVADTDNQYYISMNQTKVWLSKSGQGSVIDFDEKTVLCGDSWFDRYNKVAARALNTELIKKGGRGAVLDSSLGGQTAQWAIDNFDALITDKSPDHVLFHFYTNDRNSGNTIAEWTSNLNQLASMCNALGIRASFVKPFGTASEAQNQGHAEYSVSFNLGNAVDYVALTDELSDASAAINTVGKFKSKVVTVGIDPVYATGELPSDSWVNTRATRIGNLEGATYDFTVADSATYEIGKSVSGGLSSGVELQTYGVNTNNTYTPSITAEGYQQLESSFGSPSSTGASRLKFNSESVGADAHDYFLILHIRDSNVSSTVGVLSDASGGAAVITSSNVLGDTSTDINGDYNFGTRINVTQDNFYLSAEVVTSRAALPITGYNKVKGCWLIDLVEAESAFGIDFTLMSDLEIYNLLSSALSNIPPEYIRLTDSADGLIKKLSIVNGVVTVS